MDKLYIIGNGFDLYHQLDTRYTSFGIYLKANYSELFDQLLEYFGFSDLDEQIIQDKKDYLWADFETNLSKIDKEMVFEAHSDSLAHPSSPDFRDRDWNTFSIDMELVVENLTTNLFKAFKEFIQNVSFEGLQKDLTLSLDHSANYLTFNYTNTLESYYSIDCNNIVYIHGKANNPSDELILGHGIDPHKFEEEPVTAPEGLNDEELEMWEQDMSDNFDYSLELGKAEIQRYFSESFKNTSEIIKDKGDFFTAIFGVNEIFVLGHSMSEIDLPYFKKIKDSIREDVVWTASYYGKEEKHSHLQTLLSIGIPQTCINLVTLDELLIKQP